MSRTVSSMVSRACELGLPAFVATPNLTGAAMFKCQYLSLYWGIVNKNTSEIENYGAKHILVPFSNGNEFDDLKFIKFIRLCKINSLEVIRCGKKDYKKLIKLSNVIQYEHFTISKRWVKRLKRENK